MCLCRSCSNDSSARVSAMSGLTVTIIAWHSGPHALSTYRDAIVTRLAMAVFSGTVCIRHHGASLTVLRAMLRGLSPFQYQRYACDGVMC
jgi:hypothetical protein